MPSLRLACIAAEPATESLPAALAHTDLDKNGCLDQWRDPSGVCVKYLVYGAEYGNRQWRWYISLDGFVRRRQELFLNFA